MQIFVFLCEQLCLAWPHFNLPEICHSYHPFDVLCQYLVCLQIDGVVGYYENSIIFISLINMPSFFPRHQKMRMEKPPHHARATEARPSPNIPQQVPTATLPARAPQGPQEGAH